jgi:hypothetical protein
MAYTRVSHASNFSDGSATDAAVVVNAIEVGLENAETTIASHTATLSSHTTTLATHTSQITALQTSGVPGGTVGLPTNAIWVYASNTDPGLSGTYMWLDTSVNPPVFYYVTNASGVTTITQVSTAAGVGVVVANQTVTGTGGTFGTGTLIGAGSVNANQTVTGSARTATVVGTGTTSANGTIRLSSTASAVGAGVASGNQNIISSTLVGVRATASTTTGSFTSASYTGAISAGDTLIAFITASDNTNNSASISLGTGVSSNWTLLGSSQVYPNNTTAYLYAYTRVATASTLDNFTWSSQDGTTVGSIVAIKNTGGIRGTIQVSTPGSGLLTLPSVGNASDTIVHAIASLNGSSAATLPTGLTDVPVATASAMAVRLRVAYTTNQTPAQYSYTDTTSTSHVSVSVAFSPTGTAAVPTTGIAAYTSSASPAAYGERITASSPYTTFTGSLQTSTSPLGIFQYAGQGNVCVLMDGTNAGKGVAYDSNFGGWGTTNDGGTSWADVANGGATLSTPVNIQASVVPNMGLDSFLPTFAFTNRKVLNGNYVFPQISTSAYASTLGNFVTVSTYAHGVTNFGQYDIAYGTSTATSTSYYVAVGAQTNLGSAPGVFAAAYSSNLTSGWTAASVTNGGGGTATTSGRGLTASYGGGVFIAAGGSPNGTLAGPHIWQSTTGSAWTQMTVSGGGLPSGLATQCLVCSAYGSNKFVVAGTGGMILYSNATGTVWTSATSGVTSTIFRLTFWNGAFWAWTTDNKFLTSTTGTGTWTVITPTHADTAHSSAFEISDLVTY